MGFSERTEGEGREDGGVQGRREKNADNTQGNKVRQVCSHVCQFRWFGTVSLCKVLVIFCKYLTTVFKILIEEVKEKKYLLVNYMKV